jgi:GH24 family phage-related lysozyme (muramidase)
MRDAVRSAFYDFSAKYEGAVDFMYQDALGLVSIGVGILADPIKLAMGLPMVTPDGTPATANEIAAEWAKVKSLGSGTYQQGNPAAKHGHNYARPFTRLKLTEQGLRDTLLGKMHQNDLYLRNRFPAFDTWSADAQLAIHSLAWGCGPAFRFPKLEAALRARDFRVASNEVKMVANGVELFGLKPRNAANRALLLNASYVEAFGLDPERLWWPRQLETDPLGP